MVNEKELIDFIQPYYADKDIMHDLWHIRLVEKTVDKIIRLGNYRVDREILKLATAFHGFIYREEPAIRMWLQAQNVIQERIEQIIQVVWESQRPEVPQTLEGKILHDAHVLEGGKTYLVVKTLITGSVRGQSLPQTLAFMKDHCLGTNKCYLPETIPLCDEMNHYAEEFYRDLTAELP